MMTGTSTIQETESSMQKHMEVTEKTLSRLLNKVKAKKPELKHQDKTVLLCVGSTSSSERREFRIDYQIIVTNKVASLILMYVGNMPYYGVLIMKNNVCRRLTPREVVANFKNDADLKTQHERALFFEQEMDSLVSK